jgi:UDP-MurNAc hydroxylase
LDEQKALWSSAAPAGDLLDTLRLWWEPLLEMAPNLRAGVGAPCLIRSGDRSIIVDFPAGTVRSGEGPHAFRFDIEPALLDAVVARRAVDWSNSLFLSCRFVAWRAGEYNEHLYNFFKSLSVERMVRAEAEATEKREGAPTDDADVRLGDYLVQRRCPHRNADLSVFGEVDGDEIVCTLHGWRFDAATGKCLTSREKSIRVRRAE